MVRVDRAFCARGLNLPRLDPAMSDLGVLLQPLRARAARDAGRRRASWLVRSLPGLAGCGLAGLLVAGLLEPGAVEPPAAPEEPVWVEAGAPLFGLASPGFGRPTRAEALVRRNGPGRQDALTFGPGPGAGDWLRLSVLQAGPLDPAPGSFYLDLARAAARTGVAVTRAALPGLLATRFGAFEAAEVDLAQGEASHACLGFRLLAGSPDLRITGLACGREGLPDKAALACTLDGLHLVAPGVEPGLARFFAAPKPATEAAQSCDAGRSGVKSVRRP